MRALASALAAASLALTLTLAGAAIAGDQLDLMCRGMASTEGFPSQRVRFHLRIDLTSRTFCYGDCREQLTFTSASDGDLRYEPTAAVVKTFEVRFQPAITYASYYHAGCQTCAFETKSHEVGRCRKAPVIELIAAITRPDRPSGPWPVPMH